MDKNIKIYVVFHHNLENHYTGDILKNLEFISVNDKIKKDIKQESGTITLESTIPGYEDLQSLRFNESSAIINLRETVKSSDFEYVGFLQYDNSIDDTFVKYIEENLTKEKGICVSQLTHQGMLDNTLPSHLEALKKCLEIYNTTFSTDFKFENIGGPLLSTFFVHKEVYDNMILFYRNCKSIIDELLEREGIRHIGGYLERFWGMFLKLWYQNNLLCFEEGFKFHSEIKDVTNQLWRYQYGNCQVTYDTNGYKLSCSVFLPDLNQTKVIDKIIDEKTLILLRDNKINVEEIFAETL
jgi:hypothetical protein